MMKYTLGDLKTITNKGIQGKIGMLTDPNGTMDDAVRDIITHPRLKLASSAKVKSLIPSVGDDANRFKAPDDLNNNAVIDIMKRGVSFGRSYGLSLTTPEQFRQNIDGYLAKEVAVERYNGQKYILFYDDENPNYIVDNLDTISDWVASGASVNLRIDKGEFQVGTGALSFDIGGSGTSAGIKKEMENGIDITDDIATDGEMFFWAYIPSVADLTAVTLRIGSDISNYHELSTSKQYDSSDMVDGWNLLSFSLVDMPDTGTPDDTEIKYFEINLTKADSSYSVKSCRFDNIVIHRGRPFDIKYYSRNVWRDAVTLQEKEKGSNDGDFLEIDAEEWKLIKQSALALAAHEADIEDRTVITYQQQLDNMIADYFVKNPSRALTNITNYGTL